METQGLQSSVREHVVGAFRHGRYAGAPFESLLQPTRNFGVRATSEAEVFALRLAVGAVRALDEIARELDRRGRVEP